MYVHFGLVIKKIEVHNKKLDFLINAMLISFERIIIIIFTKYTIENSSHLHFCELSRSCSSTRENGVDIIKTDVALHLST
jgi:hypothetical protein